MRSCLLDGAISVWKSILQFYSVMLHYQNVDPLCGICWVSTIKFQECLVDLQFFLEVSFIHFLKTELAGVAFQSEWPAQKEDLEWIDPLRVVLRPPQECSWLFIATCHHWLNPLDRYSMHPPPLRMKLLIFIWTLAGFNFTTAKGARLN